MDASGRSQAMGLRLGSSLLWCVSVLALTSSTVCAQVPTMKPTLLVTGVPVQTDAPDATVSPAGTAFPSPSAAPSTAPSSQGPTESPSSIPSDLPSDMPSLFPTPEPTLEEPSRSTSRFRQEFSVENGRLFTISEQILFEGLYASYTEAFAPRDNNAFRVDRVRTECQFLTQQFVDRSLSFSARHKYHMRTRQLQASAFIQVDFNMAYESNYTNVTAYPFLFQSHVNTDLATVAQQMGILGLNVSEAFLASRIISRPEPTMQPTSTPSPTTLSPSASQTPSAIPSDMPSLAPTSLTTSPTSVTTSSPSAMPTPRPSGGNGGSGDSGTTVIALSVVVAVSIMLVGLFVYFSRKRRLVRELEYQRNAVGNQKNQREDNDWDGQKTGDYEAGNFSATNNPNSTFAGDSGKAGSGPGAFISQSGSLVSNQSLLSAGNSIAGDSGDEVDTTHNLADEFDQYKDQNLEKMRAGVEGNLTGFDGMMSQALTRALIDEDDTTVDPTELLWGGSGNLVGVEIEASALGEVTDWLKRKETPSDDER
jgi:hypothetical protein